MVSRIQPEDCGSAWAKSLVAVTLNFGQQNKSKNQNVSKMKEKKKKIKQLARVRPKHICDLVLEAQTHIIEIASDLDILFYFVLYVVETRQEDIAQNKLLVRVTCRFCSVVQEG